MQHSSHGIEEQVFKNEHIQQLVPLYANAFGIRSSASYLVKKFFAPYQTIHASSIAFDQSQLAVSFYGVIRQKARLNDWEFSIGQSCDSMTHIDFGGRGLFIKLAIYAYAQLGKEGVGFVYGFPNERIYGLRKNKLHWQFDKPINQYEIKIKALPLAKLAKRFSCFTPLYLAYAHVVLKSKISNIRCFENSVQADNIGSVVHDAEYFQYKNGPGKYIIKLQGIHFWIKLDGGLWVGDFETCSPEVFSRVLAELKIIARKLGCTSIRFHYHEHSQNDLLLKTIMNPLGTMPCGFRVLHPQFTGINFHFCAADFDTW